MGAIYDDLDGHEGYGARRLPDGTLTSSWTAATADFSSYVSTCECGWHGTDHPPTDAGYEEAIDEWDEHHAQTLLARAVPVEVRDCVREAKEALITLCKERPQAGLDAIQELGSWAEAAIGRLRSPSHIQRPQLGRDQRPPRSPALKGITLGSSDSHRSPTRGQEHHAAG